MVIDATTNVGKVRLRIGDWGDIPILPDSVIQQTLADNNNNLPQTSKLCAQYILGTLTSKVHRKMSLQLEVFGSEWYKNYRDFLVLTIKDPAFMDVSPIPVNVQGDGLHPLMEFTKNWNLNYAQITVSQQMEIGALGSPNSDTGWVWPQ